MAISIQESGVESLRLGSALMSVSRAGFLTCLEGIFNIPTEKR
jgi:hypothetical protein